MFIRSHYHTTMHSTSTAADAPDDRTARHMKRNNAATSRLGKKKACIQSSPDPEGAVSADRDSTSSVIASSVDSPAVVEAFLLSVPDPASAAKANPCPAAPAAPSPRWLAPGVRESAANHEAETAHPKPVDPSGSAANPPTADVMPGKSYSCNYFVQIYTNCELTITFVSLADLKAASPDPVATSISDAQTGIGAMAEAESTAPRGSVGHPDAETPHAAANSADLKAPSPNPVVPEGLSPDPVFTIADIPAGAAAMTDWEVPLTQPVDALEDTNSDNSDSDGSVTSKCLINSLIIFYQSTQIVNSQ